MFENAWGFILIFHWVLNDSLNLKLGLLVSQHIL